MGNGEWHAVTIPRWQIVMWVLLGSVFGAGATTGVRFATGAAQVNFAFADLAKADVMLARADTALMHRIDSLSNNVGSLSARINEVIDLTRGLSRARCRETPNLAGTVGLPCRQLLGER